MKQLSLDKNEGNDFALKYFSDIYSTAKLRKIKIDGKAHFILSLESSPEGAGSKAIAYAFKPSADPLETTLELVQILGHETTEFERLQRMSKYSKDYAVQLTKMEAAVVPLAEIKLKIEGILETDETLKNLLKEEMELVYGDTQKQISHYRKLFRTLMFSTVDGRPSPGIKVSAAALIDGFKFAIEQNNKKVIPGLEKKLAQVPDGSKAKFEEIKTLLTGLAEKTEFKGMYEAHKALTGDDLSR